MAMSWIWTGMAVVSLIFAAWNGTMDAVGAAALEGAGAAVQLCIAMAGVLCLWSGEGGELMYRYKIEELKKWKESPTRKPMIIRGARQVGKTWLMKEFGKEFYEKCAYINFDDNSRMNKLFEEDFDLDRIIQGLKIESGVNIEPENTLIIFELLALNKPINLCPSVNF